MGAEIDHRVGLELRARRAIERLEHAVQDAPVLHVRGQQAERQVRRLSQVTDPFAARRMDAGIKAALAGRQLNEIEE